MRLTRLQAENIFSLSNIDLSLDNLGPVLITGYSLDENTANGAGKSSLANKSIVWGLFGQTAGGLKGDSVINRYTKGQAKVEITFEGNDGNTYVVERTRNPNSLRLIQNQIDITRKLEKDTQHLIEVALGRTFEMFVQTDLFGQGKFSSYLSLPVKEQKQVLENILSLDRLSNWSDKARKLKAETHSDLSKSQMKLSNIEGQRQEVTRQLSGIENKVKLWSTEHKIKVANLKSKLQAKREALSSELERQDVLQIELNRLEEKEEDFKLALSTCNESLLTVQRDIKQVAENQLPNAKAKHLQWEEYLNKLKTMPDNCPTCNGLVDKSNVDQEIEAAASKVQSYESEVAREHESIKGLQDEAAKFTHEAKRITDLLAKLSSIRKELSYLKSSTYSVVELEEQINDLINEQNPYEGQAEELKKALEALDPEVKKINDNIAILTNRVQSLSTWANIFSKNFYAYVLDRACPFLEQRTAEHLAGLNNSQLKVKFQSTKELKSGEIKDEFNIGVSSESGGIGFDSLSGGEQQLVSFSTGLALSDLAETQVDGKSNILILDEPFVELDSKNQESVVNYINDELLKQRETILIISNDEHLKSLISKRINIIKENGVSRMESYV